MLDPIKLATELINIKSITPEDNGCQSVISSHLKRLHFSIVPINSNGVTNLWAIHGNSGPIFAFSGHTDTVPAGPIDQWTSPPFAAHIRNGTLFGRGAADMKAALAAMLVASERFLTQHTSPDFRLAFMITSDEEGNATDGTIKIVDYLQEQDIPLTWCLIGEASSNQKLGDSIKVGRRGSLHGELHLIGKQGHIAYPQLADNPIHRCFKALDDLTQVKWDQGNEYFQPTSFQIYNIHADTGASNMIPGALTATFNFRFSPASTASHLQQRVIQELDSHQLNYEIEWNLMSEPFLSKPGLLCKATQQSIKKICNIDTLPNTAGGTSDGRFIAKTGCEIVELGPINKSIHQVNEHIFVEDLYKLTDLYHNILLETQNGVSRLEESATQGEQA